MNKHLEMVFVLVLAMIMLFFGMLFLNIGKGIYGADATILWASGMITYMGLKGLAIFILYLWQLKDDGLRSRHAPGHKE